MSGINNNLDLITGSSLGGVLLSGTGANTIDALALVVNEDCVFTTILTNNGGSTNQVAGRGFTGKTLTAGMFIGAGKNVGAAGADRITSVTLASGSVMYY